MVVDRIRQRCGENFLIEYRMSGCEEIEGACPRSEGIEFAKLLDGKVDLIHVSAGLDTREAQAVHTPPCSCPMASTSTMPPHQGRRCQDPGGHSGGINTPELAEQISGRGQSRCHRHGPPEHCRPLLPGEGPPGPQQISSLPALPGLSHRTHKRGNQLSCAVNPRTAQECRFDRMSPPAKARRKVLVVGGGPAGLEAAATAARRGHTVTLAESTEQLGGLLEIHRL